MLPYPLGNRYLKADVAVRTYGASGSLGADGPARLPRRRLQRASLFALWADELAEPDGLGGGATHEEPQTPDLWKPAPAARAVAARRRARDARLPLDRRPISGFARGIPREYQVHNVPLSEFRERFEEADQIVTRAWSEDIFSDQASSARQRRGDVAVAGAETRPGDLDADRRQQGVHPVRGQEERADHARAGARRPAGRHHPRLRQASRKERPPDHAAPSVDCAAGLYRRQQGAGGRGAGPTICISTARCSATATSPRPPSSATTAMSRNPPSTT